MQRTCQGVRYFREPPGVSGSCAHAQLFDKLLVRTELKRAMLGKNSTCTLVRMRAS